MTSHEVANLSVLLAHSDDGDVSDVFADDRGVTEVKILFLNDRWRSSNEWIKFCWTVDREWRSTPLTTASIRSPACLEGVDPNVPLLAPTGRAPNSFSRCITAALPSGINLAMAMTIAPTVIWP